MASLVGFEPTISRLRSERPWPARLDDRDKTCGAADGNRTRIGSVDSGVPYQSVSTAQMGVSESTHLQLHHPALRLGAPTNVEDTVERCLSGDQPGLPQRYRAQPDRPAGIRTRIASFGGMCPVQLSDRPKMVRAEGFEPSRLCVRSAVSCPVERRPHNKMVPGPGIEPGTCWVRASRSAN